jgi:tetratricopeptide (TPR) repeat protein
MKSPAQRHFERVSAALAAASAAPGETPAGGSLYELMLAKLDTDRRRLKSLQSIERKVAAKIEMLPEYAEYVAGALEGGRGAQDDVLVTVMVWLIDVGNYAGALEIARYALQHGLKLPDQYDRTLATVVAEEFAEKALIVLKAEDKFDVDPLQEVATLTEPYDMPDQARAKLYKALGYATQADPALALPHLRRALALYDRVGVKKDIERLEKQLADAASRNAGSA